MSTEKNSELIVNTASQVPAFLQKQAETGLESASQFIVPPRLKIVQKQSQPPISERFNAGDVITMPAMLPVAEMPYDGAKPNEKIFAPFTFTPLFWFVEWATWNPIELKGTEPAILERSLDPAGMIARKSKDERLRMEEHPTRPDLKIRHCEHIVFVFMLDQGPFAGMPVVHSFMRAEHRTGSSLLMLCKMRKAPIWSMRFQASVSLRSNDQGTWYGFDIGNPDANPWISETSVDEYRAMYEDLRDAHLAGQLMVDHDDDVVEATVRDTVTETAEY